MSKQTVPPCRNCNGPTRFDNTTIVHDPLYRGPHGHAPAGICAGCWEEYWDHIKARISHEGRWEPIHEAVWQLAHGASRQRAAQIAGMHRSTIWRCLRKWRQNPALIPEWLSVRFRIRMRRRIDPGALR